MQKGSLYSLIHDHQVAIGWQRAKKVCLDTCCGMSYLHSLKPPLVHRDLKSGNLLVGEDWNTKIADFGLSRLMPEINETLTACGTPAWSAPELLQNEKYNETVDVYSFAIVMWELLTRKTPYEGLDAYQIIFSVSSQQARPPVPKSIADFPVQYVALMKKCWADDPESRPTFSSLEQYFSENL